MCLLDIYCDVANPEGAREIIRQGPISINDCLSNSQTLGAIKMKHFCFLNVWHSVWLMACSNTLVLSYQLRVIVTSYFVYNC